MKYQSSSPYVHRPNRDGSYDSICTACYATVASVRDEAELTSHEHSHECLPDWAYQTAN
jgi:hypothetical protein